jgi:hypothetical protein
MTVPVIPEVMGEGGTVVVLRPAVAAKSELPGFVLLNASPLMRK